MRGENVATFSASSCGRRMCDVMMLRVPAPMAAANGSSSRARRVSSGRSTIGIARCESEDVSPCPGKCFALAATPVDCRPSTHATVWRETRSGSAPKLRVPMTGLRSSELMSASGAKSSVMPAAASSRPTVSAIRRVRSRSSMRPRMALPGYGDPVRWCRRVTSPPSSSTATTAFGFAWRIAAVSSRTCDGEAMLVANRQTPASPSASRSRSQPGSVVPSKPGSSTPSAVVSEGATAQSQRWNGGLCS
jgi:hypothetical protein